MHTARRLLLLFLVLSFAALVLPVFGQRVIATLPVGRGPLSAAVNAGTNKIYVADWCGNDPQCISGGTMTVIDGATDNTLSVNVGYYPYGVAVNPVTNRIYVANRCGNDPACANGGTVSVIDGVSNVVIATVQTGGRPYSVAVNSVSNRIYVPNYCGTDFSCHTKSGTVTVIDGASNSVVATVTVGSGPDQAVVNPVTNKIYVANQCGADPTCTFPYSVGTMTEIDGVTNNTASVNVGYFPSALDVNPVSNKIYVANQCGDLPNCGTATMTAIDGATLTTTDVAIGGRYPLAIAVNSVTNKIYVSSDCHGDASCQGNPNGTVSVVDGLTLAYSSVGAGVNSDSMAVNSVTNTIYVANECGSDRSCGSNGTVTVIDGTALTFTNVSVGNHPYGLALNSTTNRIYVPNYFDETVSVMDGTPVTALQFVALTPPCRAVDTRPGNGGGGPIQGGTHQDFAIAGAGTCGAMPSSAAYSMNVSVIPDGPLGYLTVWPAGYPQPLASTLNSLDGRIKANAAIIPAGSNGDISVFASNTTNVVVDVNGYFAPVSGSTLAFYPLTPCRVADTRHSGYPQGLGPPFLNGGQERAFPILNATNCNIPSSAAAYSLNFSVVPHGSLFFMTVWPTGENRPVVSTLNDIPGQIIANAAIVVAGTTGDVSVYPTNDTDLVIDINGYFAPAGTGGLSLYGVQPCRVIDTRHVGNGQPFSGNLTPPVDVVDSSCSVPSAALAYVFNASVVPTGALGYLDVMARRHQPACGLNAECAGRIHLVQHGDRAQHQWKGRCLCVRDHATDS